MTASSAQGRAFASGLGLNCWPPFVQHQGVIAKRSPAFHKSWQKRYCVLKKRQRDIVKLYYYRSKVRHPLPHA